MKNGIADVQMSNEVHTIQMIKDWKLLKKVFAYIKRTEKNSQVLLRFTL